MKKESEKKLSQKHENRKSGLVLRRCGEETREKTKLKLGKVEIWLKYVQKTYNETSCTYQIVFHV